MRVTLTHVALAVLLMCVALPKAHAQFEKWPGFIKNYELGYGYSKSWADYKLVIKTVRGEDGKVYDTTISKSVTSKGGFSGQTGTSINLKRLGYKSQLALGIAGIYNLYTWDYAQANNATLTDSGVKLDYTNGLLFSGATFNAGLAISADFKFGAEAMMDKQYHLSWCGGIGVMPSVSATADIDNADIAFGVQPFIKTEFGVRGPIVCKLRLLYAFTNLTYLDVKNDKGYFFSYPNSDFTTKLIGKGNFTVSLVLLPFSWTYKKSEWFNSY